MGGRGFIVCGAIVVAVAMPVPALAGDGTFSLATGFNAGNTPVSIAIGDFDSDGDTDLATANRESDNASVLTNNDGLFHVKTDYAAGDAPCCVAVADFDSDGDEDLAVANSDSDNVTVRLGNGNGTFAGATSFAVGDSPRSLAVADLDADDDDDLVTANDGSDNVSVLLGNGSGAFSKTDFASGGGEKLAVADFDSDGDEDLALTEGGAAPNPPTAGTPGELKLLSNNGSGSFSAADLVSNLARGPVDGVVTGDFDSDGDNDIAVAAAVGQIATVLGDGTGDFGAATVYQTGSGESTSIAVADVDSDGDEDLAVGTNHDDVAVLRATGGGAFAAPSHFPTPETPRAIAVGYLNADGVQDLATAEGLGARVSTLPGRGPALLSGNLLTNGGAEGAGAARTISAAPQIPGWTRGPVGSMTYVRYSSASGFPSYPAAARWEGGRNFFSGGPNSLNSSASQTVDVSGSASSIDAGLATARVVADLGGDSNSLDAMRAKAEFYGASGMLGTMATDAVGYDDRKNVTQLIRRAASAAVPIGTRQITVTLEATRIGGGTYANGYADNVKLTLDAPAAATSSGGDGGGAGGGDDGSGGGTAPDTDSPETNKGKGPKKKISKPKAKFEFSSDEPGSTFECKLDKKKAKPCTSPWKVRKLKDGKHIAAVTAVDAVGNRDGSPAVWKFKVT